MVAGMGFEVLDAASVLLPDPGVPDLFGDMAHPADASMPAREAVLNVELPATALDALRDDPDIAVTAVPAAGGEPAHLMATMTGEISDAQAARLMAAAPAAERELLVHRVRQHNDRLHALRSPAHRGVPFASVPQLCLRWQDEVQLLERETLAELVAFDLLRSDPRPDLPGFALVESSDQFEIFMNDARVEWRRVSDSAQLSLDAIPTSASEDDLLRWLAEATRRDSLVPAILSAWLVRLLAHLQGDKGLTLTGLVRARHALAQAVMRRLDALEAQARQRGFEQLVLAGTAAQQTAISPQ
jgi:type III restriction enzyme